MPVLEIIMLQGLIVGGWVVLTQGRRLRRLERRDSPRHPLSAQVGMLREEVRDLRIDHDEAGRLDEQHRQGMEDDLRVLAARVERLHRLVANQKGLPRGGTGRRPTMRANRNRDATEDAEAEPRWLAEPA